jgi:capsule polysaccharide export protein KpsE/RkpR
LTGAASTLGLKNPADLYVGLLGSRTIADHIIDRFQLSEVYKARTRMDARETLRSRTQLSSGKDTLIKISVDDTDSRRAAEIANMYVSELNNLNSGMASSDAAQRRQFLERRLKEEKDALSVAEEQMKQKQVNTGVFHLEGQAQVAIAAVAQLRAQIAAEEIALQRLSMGATAENPEVMRTRTEISALRSQLSNLERSSRRDLGDPLLRTSTIPTATLEYVRGVRDLKYHETLFELLSKQYEAARIDEAKAAPELGLVDAAVAPEKKSSPHRLLLILFSFAGSGIFATALAAFMSRLSNDQDARRLRSLKSSLRTW